MLLVWMVPVDSASCGVRLLVEGESTFTFTAWEPPLLCLAWKILITLSRNIDRKGVPPKIIFISILNNEL